MKTVRLTYEETKALQKYRAKNKAARQKREREAAQAAYEDDFARAMRSRDRCTCGHEEREHTLPRYQEARPCDECLCEDFQSVTAFRKQTKEKPKVKTSKRSTAEEAVVEPFVRVGRRKIT